MRKTISVIVGAAIAAVAMAPEANAKHRHAPLVIAPVNPVMNDKGEFYATPMQTDAPTGLPGLGLAPGVGVAGGVVNGVTQPLLAPVSGLEGLPGLDVIPGL